MKIKHYWIFLIIVLIFISTSMMSSSLAKTNGPDLKVISVGVRNFYQYPMMFPYKMIYCKAINVGNSDITYLDTEGEAHRSFIPSNFFSCSRTQLFAPSQYWKPQEIREVQSIAFDPFINLIPGIFHVRVTIGTIGDLNPEDNTFERDFFIFNNIIYPTEIN
jgi:hypothetical protein